jgi:hypothetical protein
VTLPVVKTEFTDFNLGLVTPSGSSVQAKIGVAQAGPTTPQSFTRSAQVAGIYAGGPLASAIAVSLADASPVVGLRLNADVAGTIGAVTPLGTGTSTATTSGASIDASTITATITRPATGPTTGLAALTLTVNGVTGSEIALPASGAVVVPGTGVTLTFAAGTLVAGDTYTLSATAPGATLSTVMAGLTALLDARPKLRFVHVLGTATAALVAAVDTLLQGYELHNYFLHGLLEARPMQVGETASTYLAAITTQFAGVASDRVAIALDGGLIYNPLTRTVESRNSAWKASGRRMASPIGEAAYRVRSGSLSGITALNFDANTIGTSGRFLSLRTFDGREGVYVTDWPLLSVEGSDYDAVQAREVADEAARVGYLSAIEYLGDDVEVDPVTGHTLETEALAFEAFVAGRIRAALGANASGIRVTVDRTENILSTKHFAFDVGIIPLGYLRSITVRVGYINPALLAQASATPTSAVPTAGGR